MNVEVIQFMRPNGNKIRESTDIPDELEPIYEALTKANLRFTAEVLRTGEVSLTIEGEEGDLCCEVVENGPGVQEALAKMLREWDERGRPIE
jgi:hypothetical protein